MNTQLAFGLGGQELLIVLAIVLLLFGGTRLPRLAKGLGQSVREFKKGIASPDEAEADAAEPRQLG
jgi:sec-independent protein translocase protein TatA